MDAMEKEDGYRNNFGYGAFFGCTLPHPFPGKLNLQEHYIFPVHPAAPKA